MSNNSSIKFLSLLRILTLLAVISLTTSPLIAVAQSIDLLFQQGDAAEKNKNYAQAESIWRQVIQREPQNAVAYYRLGNMLLLQQKSDDAIFALQTALQINPNYVSAHKSLCFTLQIKRETLEKAIPACRQALKLAPDDVFSYTSLGGALIESGSVDEGISLLKEAVNRFRNPWSYFVLINALRRQNKVDEALDVYCQEVQCQPNSAESYTQLADKLIRKKMYDVAIAAYRRANQLAPNSDTYNVLGLLLQAQGRLDDAIVAYQNAIALTSDRKGKSVYNNNLGNALYQQKKFQEALQAYQAAVQLADDIPLSYNGLGNTLKALGFLDEAIRAYERAIKLDSKNPLPYNGLGDALYQQGKLDKAIITYKQGLQQPDQPASPANVHTLIYPRLGQVLGDSEDWEGAKSAFREAIQREPKNPDVYYFVGNVLLQQGRKSNDLKIFKEALEAYQKATDLRPGFAWAQNGLGDAYIGLKETNKAVEAYRKAIHFGFLNKRDLANAHNDLGYALFIQNDPDEAIKTFEEANKIDPDYASSYGNLGLIEESENKLDIDAAIQAYSRYTQLKPEDFSGWNQLGKLLLLKGRFQDASQEFNKAIRLKPDDPDAYLFLGKAKQAQGQGSEAITAFNKAIQLIKSHEDTRISDAYSGIASILAFYPKTRNSEVGQDSAINLLKKAIQANPKSAIVRIGLGDVLYSNGKENEAITEYRQVLTFPNLPDFPTCSYAMARSKLGWIYLRNKNIAAAGKEFDDARLDGDTVYCNPDYEELQTGREEVRRQTVQAVVPDEKGYLNRKDPYLSFKRSVVRVIADFPGVSTSYKFSTGWVLKRQGTTAWIITNRHAVVSSETERQGQVFVELYYGNLPSNRGAAWLPAQILNESLKSSLDLVLLKVEGLTSVRGDTTDTQAMQLQPKPVKPQTQTIVISPRWQWKTRNCQISDYASSKREKISLRCKEEVPEGASGSPILNRQNQVVGLMVAVDSGIPLSYSSDQIIAAIEAWGIKLP